VYWYGESGEASFSLTSLLMSYLSPRTNYQAEVRGVSKKLKAVNSFDDCIQKATICGPFSIINAMTRTSRRRRSSRAIRARCMPRSMEAFNVLQRQRQKREVMRNAADATHDRAKRTRNFAATFGYQDNSTKRMIKPISPNSKENCSAGM
jgi:hypothetical protein